VPVGGARTDGGSLISLLAGIFGLILGVALGIPGLILGPLAYFMGKASVARIDSSQGKLQGRSSAAAGWVIGVIATALGAIVTLVWFVIWLVATSGPPPT
jgi:uncharacterized protein YqgC (DUF456 family)